MKKYVVFEADGRPAMIVPEDNLQSHQHLEHLCGIVCRPALPEEVESRPHLVVQKRRPRRRGGGAVEIV